MLNTFIYTPAGELLHFKNLDALQKYDKIPEGKLWLDLQDPTEEEIEFLLEKFQLQPMNVEELLFGSPAPKIDFDEKYAFLILHHYFYDFKSGASKKCEYEIFFAKDWILTHHESNFSVPFDAIGERILDDPEATLKKGSGYILTKLLELTFKSYPALLENWEDRLEDIEDRILSGQKDQCLTDLLQLKKMATAVRKNLLPDRDVLHQLFEHESSALIGKEARLYFKKAIHQINALLQNLDALRENARSVFDVYAAMLSIQMTEASHQLNFVMQRLTIAATIFMPLTFIVGVYGMNIESIPELKMPGFYYLLWGIMISLSGGMIYFFKRKKWL